MKEQPRGLQLVTDSPLLGPFDATFLESGIISLLLHIKLNTLYIIPTDTNSKKGRRNDLNCILKIKHISYDK